MTSALEYLSALRRRLFAIVAAACIAALSTYLFLGTRPSEYTSVATILVDDATAQKAEAFMRSIATAREVAKHFPEKQHAAYRFRWWSTSGEPRRTASLFNFGVTDRTAESAQAMSNVLIEVWLDLTKPRPGYKEHLLQELERTRSELRLAGDLIQQIQTGALRQANYPMLDPAATLPALLARRDVLVQNIARTDRELRGIGPDAILTKPSLPLKADPTGREQMAAIFGLLVFISGCGLVLFAQSIRFVSGNRPS